MTGWRFLLTALVVGQMVPSAPCSAQVTATSSMATRSELVALKDQLNAGLASGKLKGDRKRDAMADVAVLESRLKDGDVQVGDRLWVTVTTDAVKSDSISVLANRTVALLELPEVSVAGILRSELTSVVQEHLNRYLRNVNVRIVPLMRVRVHGSVQRPGYYNAPPDKPVSELLMLAGGPTLDAKIDQLEITHLGRVVVSTKASRRVIEDGKTLQQLGVVSGDEIMVPKKRHINWQPIIQVALIATTLLATFVTLLQRYYDQQG